MAKDKQKVSVEVNVDDLGVLSRHHFRMANDQDYRDRALTPPGGLAPGEGDKPAAPTPDDNNGLTAQAVVSAATA